MLSTSSPWFAMYPYGGGGVGSFGALNAYLGPFHKHVPVYPGRDHRYTESAHTSFEALAEDAWCQLVPHVEQRASRNLVLFGYSLGGMVAVEMAARLEESGQGVRALIVGGAAAPSRWRTHGLCGLNDNAFIARLRALGVAPAELLDDPGVRRYMLPVWRADASVAESFRPRAVTLKCRVHVLVGTRDPLVNAADLEAWRGVGGSGSTVQAVGGDHGSIIQNPVALARLLRQVSSTQDLGAA